MSSSHSYYVGPYVETRCPMVQAERSDTTCSNRRCDVHKAHRHLSTKFCPECGAMRATVTYQEPEEAVDANDLVQQIDEALHDQRISDGVRAWIPNVGRPDEPREFHVDPEGETGAVPLDAEGLPDAERDWLRVAFAPEIAALADAYGAGNVSVRWGLVWMWS